ncbi:MAG: Fe3+-hydroxamate ABC transporter substrate-binding protein [Deltaproteobacteria bacterium]|nr:MAG: Fe3+-hydroxamate ABC transporter substrate-binding protein [Deltaproteobacteria bacterium]
MNRIVFLILLLCSFFLFSCSSDSPQQKRKVSKKSFLLIGEFSVEKKSDILTVVRDGAGRSLALVPRGAPDPQGFLPEMIIHTPVKRVITYSSFDVATLKVLGELDTLVGSTTAAEKWYVDDVRQRFIDNKAVWIGNSRAVDYERIKRQQPEMVLTWDPSIIPILSELGIPVVITSTPVAMCLNARMSYVRFLAPFFGKEKEAEAYFTRVSDSVKDIRKRTSNNAGSAKVMWGDMYEKRVLVEPGNAWIGELVGLVESDYLFEDVYGTSCIEISMERFLYSGREATIYFTYRTPATGATSKEALRRDHPLLAAIKPLSPAGKVYAPLPHYSQSGDKLDEIFTDIAAIIHPQLYPLHQLKYFQELPENEPQTMGAAEK